MVWSLQRCNNRLDDAIDMLEHIPTLQVCYRLTHTSGSDAYAHAQYYLRTPYYLRGARYYAVQWPVLIASVV
eukprot:1345281-Rhodomonas_salina.6